MLNLLGPVTLPESSTEFMRHRTRRGTVHYGIRAVWCPLKISETHRLLTAQPILRKSRCEKRGTALVVRKSWMAKPFVLFRHSIWVYKTIPFPVERDNQNWTLWTRIFTKWVFFVPIYYPLKSTLCFRSSYSIPLKVIIYRHIRLWVRVMNPKRPAVRRQRQNQRMEENVEGKSE